MGDNGNGKFPVEECELLLGKVRGVVSAKIVTDSKGIREIHLIAGTNRSPKQIVRDIESVFAAHYGLPIDHKIISIAQLEGDEPPKSKRKRPVLLGLSFTTTGPIAEVTVNLQCEGEQYRGSHGGPLSRGNSLRLVAMATLAAVEQTIQTGVIFSVEDVAVIRLGNSQVVNVAVSALTQNGEETLVGSSLVRSDERDATARAVLSALNRRFSVTTEPVSEPDPD